MRPGQQDPNLLISRKPTGNTDWLTSTLFIILHLRHHSGGGKVSDVGVTNSVSLDFLPPPIYGYFLVSVVTVESPGGRHCHLLLLVDRYLSTAGCQYCQDLFIWQNRDILSITYKFSWLHHLRVFSHYKSRQILICLKASDPIMNPEESISSRK